MTYRANLELQYYRRMLIDPNTYAYNRNRNDVTIKGRFKIAVLHYWKWVELPFSFLNFVYLS